MGNKNAVALSESEDEESEEETSIKSKNENLSRQVQISMIQNIHLVWLDNNIDNDIDGDYYQSQINQLRCIINTINTFTNEEECIQFLHSMNDEKACVIMSGSLGQQMIPRIHGMSQVNSIFIVTNNKKRHAQWTKKWSKIQGVFTEISSIYEHLKHIVQEYEQNAISISFMDTVNSMFQTNFYPVDPLFMYTKILKEIFLTLI